MPDKKKPKIFYGYVVVAAGIIASILLVGIYSSFGVFFKPLSTEFAWTRAITSAAASLATIVMGLASLATGRLTDRYGPRVTVTACGLLAGVGALLMSQVSALWQLYLFYGLLLGSGMSAADVPLTATVARWFTKRR
ncbi:MAG: MFS transporter, partial [Chloroflexi bacterium]|nr:MFS transporter [Chloroflexota bacterium]